MARSREAYFSISIGCRDVALAVGPGVSAADALAPVTAPAGPSLTVTLLRLIGGLLVVFGLFLGGIWLLKRAPMMVGKRGDTRKLQVVEMRSLHHVRRFM